MIYDRDRVSSHVHKECIHGLAGYNGEYPVLLPGDAWLCAATLMPCGERHNHRILMTEDVA